MELKEGNRINYFWKGRYKGVTPGTVTKISDYYVIVEWDDGTSTKSKHDFILKYTKPVK